MLQSNLLPPTVLKMEAEGSSETLATSYNIKWYQIPEGSNLHIYYPENLKSHIISEFLTSLNYRNGLDLIALKRSWLQIQVILKQFLLT
jgi:hypothetical protein